MRRCSGGPCSRKTELNEPIVVVILDYPGEWWIKPKIDPVELVTLRKSGLTCEEIARSLGSGKGTVWRLLRGIVEGGSLEDAKEAIRTRRLPG